MATLVFPNVLTSAPWMGFPGVTWGMKKQPTWKTTVSTAISGREARTIYWSSPLYHWALSWEFLRDSGYDFARNATRTYPLNEYQTLLAFFNQVKGAGLPFFITDPTDCVIATTAYQTLVASAAGGEQDIQLVRTLNGQTEPVGGLDVATAAPTFRVNGSSIGAAWTGNTPFDGWIHLTTPLTTGQTLDGAFHYYWKVRFEKDQLVFSQMWRDFWEAREVNFQQVRP